MAEPNSKRGKSDPVIPSLPILKCLELSFDVYNKFSLLHLSCFIKQSPHLHTLVLKLTDLSSRAWAPKSPFAEKRAANCSHDCLKVVEIYCYSGNRRQIELVKYLTKIASMEKIIFDPVNRCCSRSYRLKNASELEEREELSRAQARQLKEKLPPTLEVVCL